MYDRIISYAMRTPWALEPSKLAIIADLLRFRASGGRLSAEEIQARIGDAPEPPRPSKQDGSVAVIPIYGVLIHKAGSFEAMSGGTSAEMIGKYIRRAVADESVKAILLDISSPGGEVSGIPELATEIAAAATLKTVVASVNAQCCSAAYWLGSQASEMVITPSGQAGSIGVYLLTEDMSEYLAKEGIKINAISAGTNKLEGAPWMPLSEETKAFLQGQVDRVYADFVKAVATGRGVTRATVLEKFGQGRVYDANEALKRGMVDAVESFDDTVARLVKKAPKGSRARMSMLAKGAGELAPGEAIVPLATLGTSADTATPTVNINGSIEHGLDDSLGEQLREALAPTAEAVTPEPEAPVVDTAQLTADRDYMDTAIRIAERL